MVTTEYLIDSATQRAIITHLDRVPDTLADLETARARLDQQTNPFAPRVLNGTDEQPIPVNLAATDADRHLRWLIGSWTDYVLRDRGLTYHRPGARPGEPDTTEGAAAWLSAHVADLAQTADAPAFLPALIWALDNARANCEHPAAEHAPRPEKIPAAAHAIADRLLTAAELAAILPNLVTNPPDRKLITMWGRRGHITPVTVGTTTRYRAGDVIAACTKGHDE